MHFPSRAPVTQALSGSCLSEHGNQGGKVRKAFAVAALWEGLGLSSLVPQVALNPLHVTVIKSSWGSRVALFR